MFIKTLAIIATLQCFLCATDALDPSKWIVNIKQGGKVRCVGTIVSKVYVLTTRNCINRDAGEYKLVFSTGKTRRVSAILQSPVNQLLVLLKLGWKIGHNTRRLNVRRLPTAQLAGQAIWNERQNIIHSSGEGAMLKKIHIDVVGDSHCNRNDGSSKYRVQRHMCYVAKAIRKHKCSIMGGQPLLTRDKSKAWRLLGISLAKDDICQGKGKYQQAIDIVPHIKWIKIVIQKKDCGPVPTITNGTITLDVPGLTTQGETATVECHYRYDASRSSIYCLHSGSWETSICTLKSCVYPASASDATDTYPGTLIGSTVTYICDQNFVHTAGDLNRTCQNDGTWNGTVPTCTKMTDCYDLVRYEGIATGIHTVFLWNSSQKVDVVCDSDTDGGGWTVFQYRTDDSTTFYLDFASYTAGFGSFTGNFWLGLQYMQEMVAQDVTELRLDLTAADGYTVYENFQNFTLSDGPDYMLNISNGTGTAGDSMTYNNGYPFSTHDHNQSSDCAMKNHGGWWYTLAYYCAYANLNGDYAYGTPGNASLFNNEWGGMIYYELRGTQSIKTSKMMFRRV